MIVGAVGVVLEEAVGVPSISPRLLEAMEKIRFATYGGFGGFYAAIIIRTSVVQHFANIMLSLDP